MTKSRPTHESWLQAFLEEGEERSVSKLIGAAPRIASERDWDRVPSPRSFRKWFTDYGWEDHAQRYDANIRRQARYRYLREQAELEEILRDQALESAAMFHALVESALTVEIPVPNEDGNPRFTVNNDGSLTAVVYRRRKQLSEFSRHDINFVRALHRAAEKTERDLLAGSVEQYEESLSEEDRAPGVNVLGRESLHEMKVIVNRMNRRLDAQAKRREGARGASAAGHADQYGTSAPRGDADAPGLEWEEVGDDDTPDER